MKQKDLNKKNMYTTTIMKKVKLKCQRCLYTWKYKGTMLYASCPNCLTKVKNEKHKSKS